MIENKVDDAGQRGISNGDEPDLTDKSAAQDGDEEQSTGDGGWSDRAATEGKTVTGNGPVDKEGHPRSDDGEKTAGKSSDGDTQG